MSTFRKPNNVRYVDMAIYVDDVINRDELTPEESNRCYEYLYHLYNMIAVKGKYFNSMQDYDRYALYAATCLFLRYQRAKVPNTSLAPIKSCLNYIKMTAYPLRVNYQKETFAEHFNEQSVGAEGMNEISDKLTDMVRTSMWNGLYSDFSFYLSKITRTIRNFVNKLPYRKNKLITHNIYISCLITLLKSFTLSNKNKARVESRVVGGRHKHSLNDNFIDTVYKEEQQDAVTLYHLDSSMYNYIATIVNEIKREIADNLWYIVSSHEPTDAVVKSVLTTSSDNINGVD